MMMLAPTIKKHSLVFNPGILAMERYAGDSDLDWFITKTYLHPNTSKYGIWENPCRIALRLEFLPIEPQRNQLSRGRPLEGGWADEGPRTGSLAVAHGDTNCPAKKNNGSMGYGHAQNRM
jgi:hypothetical protein